MIRVLLLLLAWAPTVWVGAARSEPTPQKCGIREDVVLEYLPNAMYPEAEAYVTEALSSGEFGSGCSVADLYSLRARIRERVGDLSGAIGDLNVALDRSSDETNSSAKQEEIWILVRRCELFSRQGLLASARIDCQNAFRQAESLGRSDLFGTVSNAVGALLAQLGDFDGAVFAWQQGIQVLDAEITSEEKSSEEHEVFLRAMIATICANLAVSYYNIGEYDRAVEFSTDVLDSPNARATLRDNRNVEISARSVRANAYLSMQEFSDAAEDFEALVRVDGAKASGHLNGLCWSLAKSGSGSAVSACERAVDANPKDPAVLDSYGFALVEAEEWEKAVSVLEMALAMEPDYGWSLYHIARAYAALGRGEEAARAKEKMMDVLEEWPELKKMVEPQ